MKGVLFYYMCCVLFFSSGFLVKTFHAYTVYKVGNLYPKADYNSLSLNQTSNFFESSITKAIHFASNALQSLFLKTYGCHFDLKPSNTKCDVSFGTNSFFELIKDLKRTLLVFIGSCDSTIKPIAESVQFFNLTLLSYTETDPTFFDQAKYNGFYSMVPGEEQHNSLRLHLIKTFNWTRIGTIFLAKAKYNLAHNLLIKDMDRSIIVVTRSIMENQTQSHYESILNDFIQNDIKILIGIFDPATTLKLFCHIYKNGMYGANYQWIILGSYEKSNILAGFKNNSKCTYEELVIVLNGTLFTKIVEYSYEFDLNGNLRIEKSKVDKIEKEYENIVQSYMSLYFTKPNDADKQKNECPNPYFHGYAFDGLLTIFKVLSYLIKIKKLDCQTQNFVRNTDWFHNLNQALDKIKFKGVTGTVSFKNANRFGQIKLEQLIAKKKYVSKNDYIYELKELLILVHDQNKNKFVTINDVVWHGKNPPKDQTIKVNLLHKIPKSMLIIAAILASSGIILAIGFLVFNVKFRNHRHLCNTIAKEKCIIGTLGFIILQILFFKTNFKVFLKRFIKMSSPNLNNLIIFGSFMSYTSIFFLNEHDALLKVFSEYICVIKVWLLTIGFTLAFGAMFSKTYRVHAILTNSNFSKKVIKDYKLFGLVIFLLVIEVTLLVVWQIIDPLHLVKKPSDVIRDGEKMVFVETRVCESSYMKIWLAGLVSYKSLLILFGCFFAYETRHVTIAALNDSKYIGISVYNVLIMCTAGSVISFIVHDRNSAYILITLFIFACTTITLCLVFIPKIIQVKKDPIGKKKQRPKIIKKTTEYRHRSMKFINTEELDAKINHLVQDNRAKEALLEQINEKIEMLVKKAKNMGSEWLNECLKLIDADDVEIKKIIDKLNYKIENEPSEEIATLAKIKRKVSRDDKINNNKTSCNDESNIEPSHINELDKTEKNDEIQPNIQINYLDIHFVDLTSSFEQNDPIFS